MFKNAKNQFIQLLNVIRRESIKKPWLFFFCLVFLIWFISVLWITYKANRMGFGSKTLWDWFDLLIVPIVLAVAGLMFNWSQRKTELDIAEKNRREDRLLSANKAALERELAAEKDQINILDAYFDRMSNLLLNFGLRDSSRNDEERKIARARTLSTLINLDEKRKGQVLHFLVEAKLVFYDDKEFPEQDFPPPPIIDLHGADLSGAEIGEVMWGNILFMSVNLRSAKCRKSLFGKVSFHESNLENIDMEGCRFKACDFSSTNMQRAILRDSKLDKVDFTSATLDYADLSNASLIGADFASYGPGRITSLKNTNLQGANLEKAYMLSADFRGANLSGASLIGAQYNHATKWPIGFDPAKEGAILVEEDW